MAAFTTTLDRTEPKASRTAGPRTVQTRLERRWFKVEGKLECRYVMVQE
jgi:hypothetical protein